MRCHESGAHRVQPAHNPLGQRRPQGGVPQVAARYRVEDGRAAVAHLRRGQPQLPRVAQHIARLAPGSQQHRHGGGQLPHCRQRRGGNALIRPNNGAVQIQGHPPDAGGQISGGRSQRQSSGDGADTAAGYRHPS